MKCLNLNFLLLSCFFQISVCCSSLVFWFCNYKRVIFWYFKFFHWLGRSLRLYITWFTCNIMHLFHEISLNVSLWSVRIKLGVIVCELLYVKGNSYFKLFGFWKDIFKDRLGESVLSWISLFSWNHKVMKILFLAFVIVG